MSEFLSKLSSYNIFNYLVPGVVFAILADTVTSYKFLQDDIVVGLFLYYFIGLVVSRVGSLIIEPSLRKIRFLETAPYTDFIEASKKDEKLETLSEANNAYRTFVATFLSVLTVKAIEMLGEKFTAVAENTSVLVVVMLFVLFVYSYRKQNSYVVRRIEHAVNLPQGEQK